MSAFFSFLNQHDVKNLKFLVRGGLTTLQVNMGNLCNLSCKHCHIEASPQGNKIMSEEIVDEILEFISRYKIKTLDITGGSPEMNPNFELFVQRARPLVEEIIVRTNLTILLEKDKHHLMEFYKKNKVHIIGSLPCYLQKNVDAQRGNNVYDDSINVLKKLNAIGFAGNKDLQLDLVYNPIGATLPPDQRNLENDYKENLGKEHGIKFNRLITITNVPIKRFKTYLKSQGEYEEYCELLKKNFNPQVLENLMCRSFLSVAFDGRLYDCDFNLALGLALKDNDGNHLWLKDVDPENLEGKDIIFGEHCFSCTAGSGSSCQGAMAVERPCQAEILNDALDNIDTKENVKDYYGRILESKNDLKTSACCSSEDMPRLHKKILKKIEPEILNRFYGCGSPLPEVLEGCTVLDLGCGTGRDVYLASYLVGEKGDVIGVDMTAEQLDIAKKFKLTQMRIFGYQRCNVQFKKGYIEDLQSIGIEDNSVDVVISNCVVNLSPDKKAVFSEIFRVLKPGGELFFSDVFAGRRIPDNIKKDPIFFGECLGGSIYIEDFRRLLNELGCKDYRTVAKRKIMINNAEMEEKAGAIDFYSMTIRAFKIDCLEDICEDYGQVATYLGTINGSEKKFTLDDHHVFIENKPMLVCGNTAAMLNQTRYACHFMVEGTRKIHFGPFDCSGSMLQENIQSNINDGCC